MGYALKVYQEFLDLGEAKAAVLADFIEYIENQRAVSVEELKDVSAKTLVFLA